MGAISSLSTGFGSLRRNPVLFVATFLTSLLSSIGLLGQALGPIPSLALSGVSILISLFVTPFITGGIIGMATEAVAGRTRFETFIEEGKANYVSLLAITFLFIGIAIAGSILFGGIALVLLVVGVGLSAGGSGAAGFGMGIGLLLFVLFVALVAFIAWFFLQFYDAAVVVSDEGAVGSLRRSASFVRHNLLSTLGFSVVYVLVSVVAAIPILVISFLTTDFTPETAEATSQMMAGPSPVELLPVILATLVLSTLTSAFIYAYKVAFYVDLAEPVVAD